MIMNKNKKKAGSFSKCFVVFKVFNLRIFTYVNNANILCLNLLMLSSAGNDLTGTIFVKLSDSLSQEQGQKFKRSTCLDFKNLKKKILKGEFQHVSVLSPSNLVSQSLWSLLLESVICLRSCLIRLIFY